MHPFRTAWETRELSVLVEGFAPDVVLHSPVIDAPFEGKEAVTELYEVLFEEIQDLRFTDELAEGDCHVFFWRASLGGRAVEGVDRLRHGPDSRIHDITVMSRPLAGAAAFASVAGPRLAAERGPVRAAAMSMLARPLPRLLELGDRAASRLALRPRGRPR
jgi:hypothetical protein